MSLRVRQKKLSKRLASRGFLRDDKRCLDTDGRIYLFYPTLTQIIRLGMSVTMQGGSGRLFVTVPGRNIFKYSFVLLNVYRFRET